MATFNDLWQLLYNHGSSNYHKDTCNQIWDDLSPERQQRLYDNISGMLRDGRFVSYNPVQAIHDNLPCKHSTSIGSPTDWNGKHAPEPTEIACYNGHWGMYTLSDIQLFNLQTKSKQ